MDAREIIEDELTRAKKRNTRFEKRVGCTPYSGKVWGKHARMLIAGVDPKNQGLKEGKLLEAPVGDYTVLGDWSKGHSFRHAVDRKLVTHPVAISKIKTKFAANLEQVFDLYFINMNAKVARDWTESGEIEPRRLYEPPEGYKRGGLGLDPKQVVVKPDHITVLYINNSATPHEPLTSWLVAHRFGHAVRRQPVYDEYSKYVQRYLRQIADRAAQQRTHSEYGYTDDVQKQSLTLRLLCQQLGTFKSARDKQLRDQYEFVHECMAQFLMTGRVRFNRLGTNARVHTGYAYGKPQYGWGAHNADELIGRFEEGVNNYCYSVIEACEGKCFVM